MTTLTLDQKFTLISASAENYFGKYAAERTVSERPGASNDEGLEVTMTEVYLDGHYWALGLTFGENAKGQLVASFGLERMNEKTCCVIVKSTRFLRGPKLRQAIIKFAEAKGLNKKHAPKAIEFLDSLVA